MLKTTISTQIFGIKTGSNVANFARSNLENVAGGVVKVYMGSLRVLMGVFDGTVNFLQVRRIFETVTGLPVLKNVKHVGERAMKMAMSMAKENCKGVGNFIGEIIMQHQDFFVPIFHRTLNVFLAFTDATNRIMDKGMFTGNVEGDVQLQ